MLTDTSQSVGDNDCRSDTRIKEWLGAQLVSRAKQAALGRVPYGKSEVTQQVFNTILAPSPVRPEQQLDVCGVLFHLLAACGKLSNQVGACIHSRVCDDPKTSVEPEGLAFTLGFLGRPEQRMPEADVAVDPDPSLVRTAELHEVRHPTEKHTVDGRPVQIQNADDST